MKHISKSSLLSRMDCAFAWYCDRVLKMPDKESVGAIVGGTFHEVQKAFQEIRMGGKEAPDLTWCKKLGKTIYDAKIKATEPARDADGNAVTPGTLSASMEDVADGLKQVVGLIDVFYPYALQIQPVALEKEFEIQLPGTEWSVYGYIDVIEKTEALAHRVSDYKTAGSSPYKDDPKDPSGNEERRINFVSEALWSPEVACYSLAYQVLYGQLPSEFMYWNVIKLKTPKVMPVSVHVTDAQISWFLNLATDMIRSIENGLHERRTTCQWCSPKGCAFWNHCHGVVDLPVGSGKFVVV